MNEGRRTPVPSRVRHQIRTQWMGALALFLVMAGGTAYGAATIGSADVIDESLTSRDIRNRQVKTADIAPLAVDGTKVAHGSIDNVALGSNSVGFDELQVNSVNSLILADGAASSKTYQTQASTFRDVTYVKELVVSCNGNDTVTGGGYVLEGPDAIQVSRSYAVDRNSWLVRAHYGHLVNWSVTVVANCIR